MAKAKKISIPTKHQTDLQSKEQEVESSLMEFRMCLLGNAESDETTTQVSETLLQKVLGAIREDRSVLVDLLDDPLPLQWASAELFFGWLSASAHRMAWGAERNELLGIIWSYVYQQAPATQRCSFLNDVLQCRDFYGPLDGLPAFLEHSDLNASELSEWLIAIRKRLGNDKWGGGLWNGLQRLADLRISSAVGVVEIWVSKNHDDELLGMCGMLLGCIRSRNSQHCMALDEMLASNPDVNRRLIFHQSWIAADGISNLKDERYREVVLQMASCTHDERDAALNFIQATLPDPKRSPDSFAFGINWLHDNLPQEPSPDWKHHVIRLARTTDQRCLAMKLRPLGERVAALMPVASEHKGTLDELDRYLGDGLRNDYDRFQQITFSIAQRDKGQLVAAFGRDGVMYHLSEALRSGLSTQFAAEALSSTEFEVRRLGFAVFRHFGHDQIEPVAMCTWTDIHLELLILHCRLEASIEDSVARFLIAIAPRVEQFTNELGELFIEEAKWQMLNLPGSCMGAIRNSIEVSPCPLLKAALDAAESYFMELKSCQRSPINSMGVEGMERAVRVLSRRRGRDMAKASEENSIIASLCSKSYTLYGGRQWQVYMGGRLGPVSEMSEISHSFEMPRLPAMDPDGFGQRRRHALRAIRSLTDRMRKQREITDS